MDPQVVQATLDSLRIQSAQEIAERNAFVQLTEEDEDILKTMFEEDGPEEHFHISGLSEEELVRMAEKLLNKDKNFAEAREIFLFILRNNENMKTCWKNVGNSYLDQSDSELAAICYKRAIQCDYEYGDAWYDLGIACTTLGQLDSAGMCYRRAIEINQADTDALTNLGLLHFRKEQLQLALDLFDAAIAQKPHMADLLANKCLCLAALNRLEEAYRLYVNYFAENSSPGNTMLNNFVILLQNMGKYEEMKSYALRLVRSKPSSYRCWAHLGGALLHLGQISDAILAYECSIQRESSYVEGWSNLGVAYGRRGSCIEAVSCASTSLQFSPSSEHVTNLFYDLAALANTVVETKKL